MTGLDSAPASGDRHRRPPNTGSDAVDDAVEPAVLPVRPYVLTNGRTEPSEPLDMMSLVRATGTGIIDPSQLRVEYLEMLRWCERPVAVTEVAARIHQSVTVTKVLLGDLIHLGAVVHSPPPTSIFTNDQRTLEAVLDGLRGMLA